MDTPAQKYSADKSGPIFPYPQSPHTVKRLLARMEANVAGLCRQNGLSLEATQYLLYRYKPGDRLTPKARKAAVQLGIRRHE